VLEELGPGQGSGFIIATALFNSAQNIVGLPFFKETLFGCFIGDIKDDEPGSIAITQVRIPSRMEILGINQVRIVGRR
jgi:hypothetical protein